MFNNIRYRIGTYYMLKAQKEIDKGDFKSIKRGLKYLNKSVSIVPLSKELVELGKRIMMEAYTIKVKEGESR